MEKEPETMNCCRNCTGTKHGFLEIKPTVCWLWTLLSSFGAQSQTQRSPDGRKTAFEMRLCCYWSL